MNWRELIETECRAEYQTAKGLIEMLDEGDLSWKPQAGSNWFTTAQLLMHVAESCGRTTRGFVTGEWRELSEAGVLPPAEMWPAVTSIDEAMKKLGDDEALTRKMLQSVSDEELEGKMVTAPWDPTERALGFQIFQMVQHLRSHKHQLFYYLKLQGKPVNTGHLWGSPE